jgi:crotonobetainyl-CoA:carnitine CoA-transferase CaiB-like acyl-CoA transferase
MTDRSAALSGVRVLDLAGQFPGALCTMMLADAGADVIKIERPPDGDPFRHEPAVFAVTGRSKRSIVLNLKDPAAKQVLWRLIDTADVLIEELRPGKLASLGFGYDRVHERRRRLVYCSLSGYGQNGPWRDWPGHDLAYMALAGALHTWVHDAGPVVPTISFADIAAAMLAAYAITLGVLSARQAGKGQFIDLSLYDVGLFTAMLDYGHRIIRGADPEGGINSAIPHYRLYPCADQTMLALAIVNEDPFWRGLVQALDLLEWEGWSQSERLAHADEIVAQLTRIFARKPAGKWQELLLAHDVPCGQVLAPGEAWTTAQASARGLVHPSGSQDGIRPFLRTPIVSDAMVEAPGVELPKAGEHTVKLLQELGLSAEEIDQLVAARAVLGAMATLAQQE